ILADREEHRAMEAVAPGEDLGQLRQRLLRTILLVPADQHDVLPLARPDRALVDDPGVGRQGGDDEPGGQDQAHGEGRRVGSSRRHHGFALLVGMMGRYSGSPPSPLDRLTNPHASRDFGMAIAPYSSRRLTAEGSSWPSPCRPTNSGRSSG